MKTRTFGTIVMIFRDESRSNFLLASVSTDEGEIWTKPVQIHVPDATNMQCAGNLPDGTCYFINNEKRREQKASNRPLEKERPVIPGCADHAVDA